MMNLRQRAFEGVRWTGVAMVFVTLGGLAQLYILVRYIEESDFGLMALINVVIAFALTFLDFGVSNGIIHKKEINQVQLSTLYWLTVLMGVGLTLLVFMASPLLALFYEEQTLGDLLKWIAVVFLINGFGHPFRVLMNKRMQFDRLAKITIFSFIISFATVVTLAIHGYGVYALVYGFLVRTLAETLLAIGMGWRDYQLRLTFQPREIGFFVKFGSFQMGEGVLNFFTRQFDVILIGKLLGTDILGSYDVLKRFLMRPYQAINPIVTGVSFPLMSKIQDEEQRLKAIFLRQVNYVCAINFPIYAFLFFHSEECIRFMFGEEWLAYDLVFCLLTATYAIVSTGNLVGSLLLAKGRADLGFYWNLAFFLVVPLLIYFSAKHSLEYMAWTLLIFQLFSMAPNYYILIKRLIGTHIGEYAQQILIPLLLSTLMGGITAMIAPFLEVHLIFKLALLFVIGSLSYLGLNYLFNRSFIKGLLDLIRL